MASSVSSERVFSSAALTITKRRSRLKGRLVEALQVVKFALLHTVLSAEQPTIMSERLIQAEPEEGEDELRGYLSARGLEISFD